MTEDQRIRLLLEILGTEDAKKLSDALGGVSKNLNVTKESADAAEKNYYELATATQKATGSTYELAEGYQVASNKARTYIPNLQQIADFHKQGAAAVTRVGDATEATSGKTSKLSQAVLQASYGFQDFTSAGGDLGQKLNSVSNNLQVITSAFGPYGVAVGVGVTAGIALYRNWDSIMEAIGEGGTHTIPTATKAVDALTAALNKDKDALAEMAKQTMLTDEELNTYLATQERIEKTETRIAGLREAEAMKATKGSAQAERGKKFTDIVQSLGGETVASDMAKIIQGANKNQLDPDFVKGLVNSSMVALARGEAGAHDRFNAMVGGSDTATAKAFQFGTPEQQIKNKEKADADQKRREDELTKKEEKVAKEAEDERRKLNEAGRQNEAQTFEELGKNEDTEEARAEMEEARRNVKASRQHRQEVKATAKDIEKGTGGEVGGMYATQAAEISNELQRQGLDAMTANQVGIAQMIAATRGMLGEVKQIKREAQRLVREAQMLNAGVSELNWGGPGG